MIGLRLKLFNGRAPRASLNGITACWWDATDPSHIASPAGKTVGASTDATGTLTLDLSIVSALPVGDPGFLLLYLPDAQSPQDALVFAGVVDTSEVLSGITLGYIAESDAAASAAIAAHQSMLAKAAAESTAQDKEQTGLDRAATADDRLATAADRIQTGADVDAAQTAAAAAALSRDSAEEFAAHADAAATAAADASRLTVGTVTTAPAGSSATATITGQPGAQVLDLTLPAGADGPQGQMGQAGVDGAQGPQGPQGPAGADGANGVDGVDGAPGPQGPMGSLLGVTTIAGTAYALSADDDGKLLYCTADTAVTITTAALPAAFSCMVIQGGVGQISIAAGAGTTVAAFGNMVKTAGQYAALTVFAPVADAFIVSGQTT